MLKIVAALVLVMTVNAPGFAQMSGTDPLLTAGDNEYLQESVRLAQSELERTGINHADWHALYELEAGQSRTFTIPVEGPGFLVVAGDRDTGFICIAPYYGILLDQVNRQCGTRAARLYLDERPSHRVDITIYDCAEEPCYFALLAGASD